MSQNSSVSDITLAFVPIARPTFDTTLAEKVTAQVRSRLEQAGFKLIGPETMISSLDEARTLAKTLDQETPDLLLALQATFADSTMMVELARTIDAPLVMWAIPEASTGGRLRLNSLCGINLAGHALTRAGHQYDYVYASSDDPVALEKIQAVALAGRLRRRLRQARLGRIGEHPAGFDTCRFDPAALKKQLGVEVVQVNLEQFFEQAREVDTQAVERLVQEMEQTLGNLAELDQTALRGTLGSYLAFRRLAEQQGLHGLAVRCWPEFFTELGCAACGAMSMMSNEYTPCSCEVDVNGTVTQLMLQWLSDEPAFGSDLVSVDKEKDQFVLWHCGLAPLAMADQPQAALINGVSAQTRARNRSPIERSNRRIPLGGWRSRDAPGPTELFRYIGSVTL